jgi:hypothetical protein
MRFSDWLGLREPADAAARSTELVEMVRSHVGQLPRITIHDLGSGTGSMARWLAPQLPAAQHWVLYDRDPDLLARAEADMPAGVTVETRLRDITRLAPEDLAGAGLITASALLDMFTADEVERVVDACAAAGCPTYMTLSVVGRVELTPPDRLDAQIEDAFNAHQRRATADGTELLGPDAADAAVEAFARHGMTALVRFSPWRLGADQAQLTSEWFRGWIDAACEQRPELTGAVAAYASGRLAQAALGGLGVVVHHLDLLAAAGEPPARSARVS